MIDIAKVHNNIKIAEQEHQQAIGRLTAVKEEILADETVKKKVDGGAKISDALRSTIHEYDEEIAKNEAELAKLEADFEEKYAQYC